MTQPINTLSIDVISDVICPWCFVGKRRLERAISALGQAVTVHWHPFQLNPAMPPEGVDRRTYRIQKFGSWERSQELDARLIAVGQSEGIDFRFDLMSRTPNTVDAHRLIWLAGQHGNQDTRFQNAVVEALFLAYFTQGQDLSQRDILIDVVVNAGMDRNEVTEFLDGAGGDDALRKAGEMSRHYQVTGVPFFVINQRVALSGAQAPETFLDAIRQAEELTE